MSIDPADLLAQARAAGLKIATAESCTGGMVSARLIDIPGSSDVVERGFVVYSNDAKVELLGVPRNLIREHGAVSEEVARAMAEGAIEHSYADITVENGGPVISLPEGTEARTFESQVRVELLQVQGGKLESI